MVSFRGRAEILDFSTFRHTKDAKHWAIAAMSGLCYQFSINMENALVHQNNSLPCTFQSYKEYVTCWVSLYLIVIP